MKIRNYRVEITEKGNGAVYAEINGEEAFVGSAGYVLGKTGSEVKDLAMTVLKSQGYELENLDDIDDIEDVEEKTVTVVEKDDDFMKEQKSDLAYIRKNMRKIMSVLNDSSVPMSKKKELLGTYNTINNSAKIMVSACAIELNIGKLAPVRTIEIEKKD